MIPDNKAKIVLSNGKEIMVLLRTVDVGQPYVGYLGPAVVTIMCEGIGAPMEIWETLLQVGIQTDVRKPTRMITVE